MTFVQLAKALFIHHARSTIERVMHEHYQIYRRKSHVKSPTNPLSEADRVRLAEEGLEIPEDAIVYSDETDERVGIRDQIRRGIVTYDSIVFVQHSYSAMKYLQWERRHAEEESDSRTRKRKQAEAEEEKAGRGRGRESSGKKDNRTDLNGKGNGKGKDYVEATRASRAAKATENAIPDLGNFHEEVGPTRVLSVWGDVQKNKPGHDMVTGFYDHGEPPHEEDGPGGATPRARGIPTGANVSQGDSPVTVTGDHDLIRRVNAVSARAQAGTLTAIFPIKLVPVARFTGSWTGGNFAANGTVRILP
ncbi:hypothetical protein FN846DRAFT_901765 [Sphaerosporella brunnea]|uniref:Uncharacterized protein n=1 Tax=Sphaerosporella brunnea TaxID=1250544 RepID=A0A5J5FC55_9PEZI|nr:hypothetical protein FN846DRAFT_901765 [Sphaerosporella brunnea]